MTDPSAHPPGAEPPASPDDGHGDDGLGASAGWLEKPPPPPPEDDPPGEPAPAGEEDAGPSREEYRALWLSVVLWPLRNGTLVAVALLAGAAAALAFFDGGATPGDRRLNEVLQFAVGGLTAVVLAVYARRVVFNTVKGDVPVPWGRDPRDEVGWLVAVKNFCVVLVITLLPFGAFAAVQLFVEIRDWAMPFVITGLLLLAAFQFPVALVAATAKDDPLAALPGGAFRVWRAGPYAGFVAGTVAVASVGLLVAASFAASWWLDPARVDQELVEHTTSRTLARIALGMLRFGALYLALVSFRVAGLLARDVPEVEEVLL